MTIPQIVILLALTVYALYRQSIRHEIDGKARFKLACIYAIVGILVGGFYLQASTTSWVILAGSMALSAAIGIARGRLTRVWAEPDGHLYSQGTPLTITLFLALVGSKWVIGAVQYMRGAPEEHGGFGEVLIMIALMAALQSEIIWQRARKLPGSVRSAR